MPSVPCACAVTRRPIMCAACTMAASSGSVSCCETPAAVLESTPPVAVILMTSAPAWIWRRVARAQASADWPLTSAFHQALDIDEWGRGLLAAMDGGTPLEALAQQLRQALHAAGVELGAEQAAQHVEDVWRETVGVGVTAVWRDG